MNITFPALSLQFSPRLQGEPLAFVLRSISAEWRITELRFGNYKLFIEKPNSGLTLA